jgi:hypothetical protein
VTRRAAGAKTWGTNGKSRLNLEAVHKAAIVAERAVEGVIRFVEQATSGNVVLNSISSAA